MEQRQYPRIALDVDAVIADEFGNSMRPVKLLNISRMGIAFAINEFLEPGSLHMFRFVLPGQQPKIRCTARIVHSSTNTDLANFRVGAKFIRIEEEDIALIEAFVHS